MLFMRIAIVGAGISGMTSGYLLSDDLEVTALMAVMSRSSDLRLFYLEDITPHYATTLQMWRERFFDNIDQVREAGFEDAFIRMWDYYLSYCEGGFLERYSGNAQMVFAKPRNCYAPILAEI
jgi:cyclopropane-fatty-acyl-phospholipid synthase